MLKRRAFFATSVAAGLVALATACGGISDPTIPTGGGQVATISGALSAGTSAPSGARVALVWKTGTPGGLAVAADVALNDGRFSMTLDAPPDSYFADASGSSSTVTAPGQTSPGSPSTSNTDDAGVSTHSIRPLDNTATGGTVSSDLMAALAGFVIYEDANGNGALDLSGSTAASPDHLLGGNSELLIVDLRAGTSLDYEKLRDKSGILPAAGFNMAWTEGRWLPLNEVELKLTSSIPHLPSPVCGGGGVSSNSGGAGSTGTVGGTSTGNNGMPAPGDPHVHCSANGRSWSYDPGYYPGCANQPPPPPEGLCSSSGDSTEPCASIGGETLPDGIPVPPGWPCTVVTDAGVPVTDASVPSDAGPFDGGSFDASVD